MAFLGLRRKKPPFTVLWAHNALTYSDNSARRYPRAEPS
jgi:hypothetical protein